MVTPFQTSLKAVEAKRVGLPNVAATLLAAESDFIQASFFRQPFRINPPDKTNRCLPTGRPTGFGAPKQR
jgi:hypothetical protein